MIRLNDICVIKDGGFYDGFKCKLLWISEKKIITSGNGRYHQAHVSLLKNNKKINTIFEFLKDEDDYGNLSKLDLIKKIKNNDKKAIKYYILKYKHKPKFNVATK
jgi:hypothetical protein